MLLSSIGVSAYATQLLPSPALRLHIAGGMGALLAGPWQFSETLRARALNLHRWMGRFDLLEVALGSIAGFVMATVSAQGPPTHLGFGLLAVL